ncbi:ribosomal protein S18-alanine N-acetyltransferase [Telluria aromaticivorans]|uniref:[Ribosomal protein bS18]-alanine N-acetyltransferase n=1 Tax=Telluria aromaticivorans TaxID=2725995 RepID=A0A7Y2JYT8_9BURK|nr:ribosomal protein S18-alanine N-acetyltransferase [Telluria aromaticivorans]NNG23421.1 ribosomal protein S18-alanine N-acetyltransferase [Telluria aromaticivorans]
MTGLDAVGRLAFAPMTAFDVDEVHALECSVFPHPWSRTNFTDSLASGYDAWTVRDPGGLLAGYYLLMYAVDEAHLLDVAVAAGRQRQGLGRYLLDRIGARAKAQGMDSILLEVRPSNERAVAVYRRYGYREIGRRKGYYPAHAGLREDAIVMRLDL